MGGRWLVDGGIVDPVPVGLARAMGARVVIAVDLNSRIVSRSKAYGTVMKEEDPSQIVPDTPAEEDETRNELVKKMKQGEIGFIDDPEEEKEVWEAFEKIVENDEVTEMKVIAGFLETKYSRPLGT